MEKEVIEILKSLGIPNAETMIKHYPHEYSGGMKQRAMIAMALSCQPELLIADEPTTNLDVTIQAQILDLLKTSKEKFATTILLITHNLGVVAEMCNKVAIMYAGKMVECSDVDTIFKRPLHPYTQALLMSIPRVDVERGKLSSIAGQVPDLINIPERCRFFERCKYAMKICENRKEPPPIIVEKNHTVSCFLHTLKGE
jgi:oligopeptide/dipeptide ABC transporter ATP-binding protein